MSIDLEFDQTIGLKWVHAEEWPVGEDRDRVIVRYKDDLVHVFTYDSTDIYSWQRIEQEKGTGELVQMWSFMPGMLFPEEAVEVAWCPMEYTGVSSLDIEAELNPDGWDTSVLTESHSVDGITVTFTQRKNPDGTPFEKPRVSYFDGKLPSEKKAERPTRTQKVLGWLKDTGLQIIGR